MTIKERFEKVSISSLSDATGGYGVVYSGIKPFSAATKFFGPAVTVWALPGDKNYYEELRKVVKAGDVVIVAAGGDLNLAAICDGFILELEKLGVAAIAVDGAYISAPEAKLPVFAKRSYPKMLGYDGKTYVNKPVSFGGAVINPGDYVYGTFDGIFVAPKAEAEAIVAAAEEIQAAEDKRIAAL